MRLVRGRKPLVHQITNYVVMNETANATLALGALPVMAHAREEVAEMVRLAGALVLNIGTLSPPWIEAMLIAGASANEAGVPVVLDPVGVGATAFRTDTAKRILDVVDVAVLRGNAGEVATLVGVEAEVRGVESIAAGADGAAIARAAASTLGVVASVTGPVDHVSDGDRVAAIANGDPLLASRHRHRLHVERDHRLLPCRRRAIRCRRRGARRLRRCRRGRGARCEGPRLIPRRAVRRAGGARPGIARRKGPHRVKVHAIVDELETARRAVAAGATVVQLRVKAPTAVVVERGQGFTGLGVTFVVNDDVEAAILLDADGVHSVRLTRTPSVRGRAGCGSAARSRRSSRRSPPTRTIWARDRSGRRRRRPTPIGRSGSKGLRRDMRRSRRARGRDRRRGAANAAACIESGAAGVAVIRAATDPALRRAVDEALGNG